MNQENCSVEALIAARQSLEYQEAFSKKDPLVSVCIATFNRSYCLLQRSLNSLLNQTYKNLQIIVVGDCCTDRTEAAIAELADPRIIFENLPQRGPYPKPGIDRWMVAGSNAMNRALDLCRGDFITHLDDDDQATLNRIELLLSVAQSEKLDFLWHKFSFQDLDATWGTLGDPEIKLGQVTTGSIFYHKYFARVKWDLFSYRQKEPGDWNRIKRIMALQPRARYIDRNLLFHFKEQNQAPFKALPGEEFLESQET